MAPSVLTVATVALACVGHAAAKQWYLRDSYDSSNFLDKFDFVTSDFDTSVDGGLASYQSREAALSQGLVKVDGKEVYIGVDHSSVLSSGRRPSVRLESKTEYNHGLFIARFSHLPENKCGTHSAFWSYGAPRPNGGEINIYNGLNNAPLNQPGFHTGDSDTLGTCVLDGIGQAAPVLSADCDDNHSSQKGGSLQALNQGCTAAEYDGPWANKDGGVYALEWTKDYIKVYSWTWDTVPANVETNQPDTDTWGTPTVWLKNTNCHIDDHFVNQKLVFNIDFCGSTAGHEDVWSQSCKVVTKADSCADWVSSSPKAFENVYFKVKDIRLFKASTSYAAAGGQRPLAPRAPADPVATSVYLGTGVTSQSSIRTPTGRYTNSSIVTSSTDSGTSTIDITSTPDSGSTTETATVTDTGSASDTATDTNTDTVTATGSGSVTSGTASGTNLPGTVTDTSTVTATGTATDINTNNGTATATGSGTSYTDTASGTASGTNTVTDTSTTTETLTATVSASDSASETATGSDTAIGSGSASGTASGTATDTVTETASGTDTSSDTATGSASASGSATGTDTASNTATGTAAGTETATGTDTATGSASDTASITYREPATETDTASGTASGTNLPVTVTSTVTDTNTLIETNTVTESASGTASTTSSGSATGSGTASGTNLPGTVTDTVTGTDTVIGTQTGTSGTGSSSETTASTIIDSFSNTATDSGTGLPDTTTATTSGTNTNTNLPDTVTGTATASGTATGGSTDTEEGTQTTTVTIAGTDSEVISTITAGSTETAAVSYTTSTVYTTIISTITKCPPNVPCTNGGTVVTRTIPLYTTVCPVTETHGPTDKAVTLPPYGGGDGGGDKTITETVTAIETITACPPYVKDCPIGKVVTKVFTTTWCPGNDDSPAPTSKPAYGDGEETPQTITDVVTAIHTVTACPSYVKDCPVGKVVTKVFTTTWCPGNDDSPAPTSKPSHGGDDKEENSQTITEVVTVTHTVSACPSDVKNCPYGKVVTKVLTNTWCPGCGEGEHPTAPVDVPAENPTKAPENPSYEHPHVTKPEGEQPKEENSEEEYPKEKHPEGEHPTQGHPEGEHPSGENSGPTTIITSITKPTTTRGFVVPSAFTPQVCAGDDCPRKTQTVYKTTETSGPQPTQPSGFRSETVTAVTTAPSTGATTVPGTDSGKDCDGEVCPVTAGAAKMGTSFVAMFAVIVAMIM